MFPALLDSCVIFSMPLRDTLLCAAENYLYFPYWSKEILDGATRNLIRTGRMTDSQVGRFQTKIREAFPESTQLLDRLSKQTPEFASKIRLHLQNLEN